MRTAVCLPGLAREIQDTWQGIVTNLLDQLPNPDVFIYTSQAYEGAEEFFHASAPIRYVVEAQRTYPELEALLKRTHYYADEHRNFYLQEIHNWKRVWELVKEHEQAQGFQYDLVVKSRPDFFWLRPLPLDLLDLEKLNTLYPYCGTELSNEFALGPRPIMDTYFGLFDWLGTEGEKYLTKDNPRLVYEPNHQYNSYFILPTYLLDARGVELAEYRLPGCQYCWYRIAHVERAGAYALVRCDEDSRPVRLYDKLIP